VGISVSRVGGKAQTRAMRQVADKLKLDLAQYRELAAFAQFGSELDKSALAQISRGERMVEIMKQDEHVPMPMEKQVVAIFAATNGYFDDVPVPEIRKIESDLLQYIDRIHAPVVNNIRDKKEITEDNRKALIAAIEAFKKERV
jgi:F-type H+-transporting ATPase subunit alpha